MAIGLAAQDIRAKGCYNDLHVGLAQLLQGSFGLALQGSQYALLELQNICF